jgi:hypothetical protein
MKQESGLDIQYPEDIQFERPSLPAYGITGSILSILSLLFMTVLSIVMTTQLLNPENNFGLGVLPPPQASSALAMWAWVPFAFTVFGAGLGSIFELVFY